MSEARVLTGEPVVFVHVHYLDVWEQIAVLLAERFHQPFRLVITTSLENRSFALPDTPLLLAHEIYRTPNRGRDIRPFLSALNQITDFSIGLKLHTKRSDHRLDGDAWRNDLLGSLLPGESGTDRIIAGLRYHSSIGIIAPDGTILRLEPWILRNMKGLGKAGAIAGLPMDTSTIRTARFVAGSMFWFRRDAISGLVRSEFQDMFEPERGQTDGTLAHALERLFALEAEKKGFLVVPARMVAAESVPDKQALLRRFAEEPPNPYLREQAPILQMIDRYLPVAKTIFQSLPAPIRRTLRRILVR